MCLDLKLGQLVLSYGRSVNSSIFIPNQDSKTNNALIVGFSEFPILPNHSPVFFSKKSKWHHDSERQRSKRFVSVYKGRPTTIESGAPSSSGSATVSSAWPFCATGVINGGSFGSVPLPLEDWQLVALSMFRAGCPGVLHT